MRNKAFRALAITVIAALATSCEWFSDPEPQQLRVRNVGTTGLVGLKVWFPGASVPFGDVQTGATTGYAAVVGGVYRYSAFSFQYNGAEQLQPVIDFVGEEPMDGERFTYDVELSETPQGPLILIQGVTRDR